MPVRTREGREDHLQSFGCGGSATGRQPRRPAGFDKQGSSTKSIRHSGYEVEIAVPKNQYTYIVFDTPPNLEHAASLVAVQEADVVIIVTGQTVVDF